MNRSCPRCDDAAEERAPGSTYALCGRHELELLQELVETLVDGMIARRPKPASVFRLT